MSDFDRIQYFYSKGWAKKPQVAQYVSFGVISPEQYKEITGDEYNV